MTIDLSALENGAPDWQLAQLNIGRILGPIDSEIMAEFVAQLNEVNALADAAPGFVWRLAAENGNATEIRPYEDERIAVNLSVWESVAALKAFTYSARHNAVLRDRRKWFERHVEAYFCMWWIPAGHIPTVAEAQARLEYLRTHGESAHAFTFKQVFDKPVQEPELL